MRKIERSTRFKRDYKREAGGRHRAALDESLTALLRLLIADGPLPLRHRDHPLGGEREGFRDCHVKPGLVPIYEKPDPGTLRLVRLGPPSEPGL